MSLNKNESFLYNEHMVSVYAPFMSLSEFYSGRQSALNYRQVKRVLALPPNQLLDQSGVFPEPGSIETIKSLQNATGRFGVRLER
jgi:hypothetical protein